MPFTEDQLFERRRWQRWRERELTRLDALQVKEKTLACHRRVAATRHDTLLERYHSWLLQKRRRELRAARRTGGAGTITVPDDSESECSDDETKSVKDEKEAPPPVGTYDDVDFSGDQTAFLMYVHLTQHTLPVHERQPKPPPPESEGLVVSFLRSVLGKGKLNDPHEEWFRRPDAWRDIYRCPFCTPETSVLAAASTIAAAAPPAATAPSIMMEAHQSVGKQRPSTMPGTYVSVEDVLSEIHQTNTKKHVPSHPDDMFDEYIHRSIRWPFSAFRGVKPLPPPSRLTPRPRSRSRHTVRRPLYRPPPRPRPRRLDIGALDGNSNPAPLFKLRAPGRPFSAAKFFSEPLAMAVLGAVACVVTRGVPAVAWFAGEIVDAFRRGVGEGLSTEGVSASTSMSVGAGVSSSLNAHTAEGTTTKMAQGILDSVVSRPQVSVCPAPSHDALEAYRQVMFARLAERGGIFDRI